MQATQAISAGIDARLADHFADGLGGVGPDAVHVELGPAGLSDEHVAPARRDGHFTAVGREQGGLRHGAAVIDAEKELGHGEEVERVKARRTAVEAGSAETAAWHATACVETVVCVPPNRTCPGVGPGHVGFRYPCYSAAGCFRSRSRLSRLADLVVEQEEERDSHDSRADGHDQPDRLPV